MARKIIVQERVAEPSDFNFRVVFWLAVAVARQPFYANATAQSSVKDVTAQELQDLRDGKMQEVSKIMNYPAGTAIAAIKTDLIAKYKAEQADFDSKNPWRFFGTYWDGTAWTNAGAN